MPSTTRNLDDATAGGSGSTGSRGDTDWVLPFLFVAVVLCLTLAIVTGQLSTRAGIRLLAPDERSELFARNLQELKRFCGANPAEALRNHCREVAAFVAQFDECKGECATLARRQLSPVPTR